MSLQEAQQIEGIARDYFLKEAGSQEGADKMMNNLAHIVKEEGAKLVHINNVLFLLLVRGKGVVEMHTIGFETDASQYAQDIVQLAQYVRNIGTKLLYTYTPTRAFDRVARLTGLPIKKTQTEMHGVPLYVYAVEF
jgi:hypothetical protein